MVDQFARLTGDKSSLHTKKSFGRRSMYRNNVVHGMLPLLFLVPLKYDNFNNSSFYLHKLSAKFIKPVFVHDHLVITVNILHSDEDKGYVKYEYKISKRNSNLIVTQGSFVLHFICASLISEDSDHRQRMNSQTHMVLDSLIEREIKLQDIQKGDGQQFNFILTNGCWSSLLKILEEGLARETFTDCSLRLKSVLDANLLANTLFSTFVGMCIPGKHATFIDFSNQFSGPLKWGEKYSLEGKVAFKSEFTRTLAEEISMYGHGHKDKAVATGRINVRVNEAPIEMPSIKTLREEAKDINLRGKVVLVTGASRGIGETTAKLFSLHGAKVIINYYHGNEDADRIVNEIKENGGEALAIAADVSDRKSVKEMIAKTLKQYGTIHILVNNAVRDAYPISFMEHTWEDFQIDLDVILKGAFNCIQEVIPLMLKNGEGKIVNVSTIFTEYPIADQAKYITSKSALNGLTRSLAVEYADKNIQVNLVVPSIVQTDLTAHISQMHLNEMSHSTPMKRNATSTDVAKSIVFLASNQASFTTGQRIMVTGGNHPFL